MILTNDDLQPMNGEEQLYQNHPNPFDQTTEISMFIPTEVQQADLYIYTLKGEVLMHIPIQQRGATSIQIEGSTLPSGMYLYAVVADNEEVDAKRMILR